jgi:2,3-dihydroxyphenylpropionate 1,2-dioxygenase
MTVQLICCSHSPLMNTEIEATDAEAQKGFYAGIDAAAQELAEFDPELIVAFYPDHFLGFFYELIPSFCIGLAAEAIEEFGVKAAPLRVPKDIALACARHLQENGFDPAISHAMRVDHGLTFPLIQLTGGLDRYDVLPIFVNCAGFPRPPFQRVRAFGAEVGRFLAGTGKRVAITGSGGLSHDAPSARMANLSPERLITRRERTADEQGAFEQMAVANARKMMNGETEARMPNEGWDRQFLRDFVTFNADVLDALSDESIEEETGYGTHEVRSWVAAGAAAREMGNIAADTIYYSIIPEWITGMGIVVGREQ